MRQISKDNDSDEDGLGYQSSSSDDANELMYKLENLEEEFFERGNMLKDFDSSLD